MKISRWTILTFVVLNNIFVFALPTMAMSVLSKQISEDIGMTVIQLGILWGSVSILSIFTSFFGGAFVDKFGPKRILIIFGLLIGVLGVLRALSDGFISLVVLTMLLGAVAPLLSLGNFKIFHEHFPQEEVILANGIMSAGMALGFLLGAQLSATLLAPMLGGWRPVFIFYSIAGMLLTLSWFFILPSHRTNQTQKQDPLLGALGDVVKNIDVWLMGMGILGVNGAITGVLGYLPFYLQKIGWDIGLASASLTAFHSTSLIFTMPIVLYSSRLMPRRYATIAAAVSIFCGFALLSVANGWLVWPAVIIAGFSRDGFMALFFTQVSETKGVRPHMIATSIGIAMMMNSIGSIFSPPLGNAMNALSPSAPFMFWAGLALIGAVCLGLVAWRANRTETQIAY